MKSKLSQFILTRDNVNIPLKIGRNKICRKRGEGHQFMSKQHGVIFVMEKENKELIVLLDSSRNGTFINSANTNINNRGVFIKPGDSVGFGSTLSPFILKRIDIINIE